MMLKQGTKIDSIPLGPGDGNHGECTKGVKETKIGSDTVLLLPWVKNGINYTESAGKDVVSGPFTGCIMTVYKRGGSRRVGHVATPECNDAWGKVKGETELIKEFKPSDHMPKQFANPKAAIAILGHVTADGKCFAVFCELDKSGTSMKVDTVVPVG